MNANDVKQPEERPQPTRSDRLLLRINHEIRTAVNATLGMTELLFDSQLTREQSYRVDTIRMTSDHLLTQSSLILDLARAEAGTLQLHRRSFPLRETLQQALELLSVLASHCGVELQTRIAHNLPATATGDPARITEILTTVVRDAIDRAEGGEISVHVKDDGRRGESLSIELNVAGAASRSIPDAGPQEECCAMTLAKCLARMMDGDLRIEGGTGTEAPLRCIVKLTVACPVEPIHERQATSPAGQSHDRRLKILVADDATHNLMLIRAFLKDEPWEVDTAVNGRVAVERAAAGSYNLILMDLDMPEMDGYAATRQIRSAQCAGEVPAVPIVALTAHSEAEAVVKSFEAGCDAHVTKPFTKASLIQTIQHYAAE